MQKVIEKNQSKISESRAALVVLLGLAALIVGGVGIGVGFGWSSPLNVGKPVHFEQNMQKSAPQQTKSENVSLSDLSKIKDRSKVTLLINDQELNVEVVNTPDSLSLGLGMREEIGSDGMLFAFDRPDQRYFWMKGMLIDLDMIWISKGVVVGITENIPAPTAKQQTNLLDLPRYYSPGPVDMVLEVPAGFSRQKGIFTGDTLRVK